VEFAKYLHRTTTGRPTMTDQADTPQADAIDKLRARFESEKAKAADKLAALDALPEAEQAVTDARLQEEKLRCALEAAHEVTRRGEAAEVALKVKAGVPVKGPYAPRKPKAAPKPGKHDDPDTPEEAP
jgi:hypothetical protein